MCRVVEEETKGRGGEIETGQAGNARSLGSIRHDKWWGRSVRAAADLTPSPSTRTTITIFILYDTYDKPNRSILKASRVDHWLGSRGRSGACEDFLSTRARGARDLVRRGNTATITCCSTTGLLIAIHGAHERICPTQSSISHDNFLRTSKVVAFYRSALATYNRQHVEPRLRIHRGGRSSSTAWWTAEPVKTHTASFRGAATSEIEG